MSFSQIYKKNYPDLYRFAFYLAKDQDVAKDLVSEAFYKAMTINTDLKTNTIKSYLIKIIQNLYYEMHRKRKRENEIDSSSALSHTEENPYRDELNDVENILKSVKEPDRSIFYMKIYGRLSYEEISDITNLSIVDLKVKIYRIRKKLMEEIKNEHL